MFYNNFSHSMIYLSDTNIELPTQVPFFSVLSSGHKHTGALPSPVPTQIPPGHWKLLQGSETQRQHTRQRKNLNKPQRGYPKHRDNKLDKRRILIYQQGYLKHRDNTPDNGRIIIYHNRDI